MPKPDMAPRRRRCSSRERERAEVAEEAQLYWGSGAEAEGKEVNPKAIRSLGKLEVVWKSGTPQQFEKGNMAEDQGCAIIR